MASEASLDSLSRLGLTLQGYDQVIALSQANINQSLERHFSINRKELQPFRYKAPGLTWSGSLRSPTIQLVDKDQGDYAYYTMRFRSGDYTKKTFVEVDGEDVLKELNVSLEGWEVTFKVTLSMTTLDKIPEVVAQQLSTPGLYTVQQLAITFGTVQRSDFDMSRTLTPGLSPDETDAVRAEMATAIAQYAEMLKRTSGVLGYALQVKDGDAARKVAQSSPSFPPTAVKPQVIAHHPGGHANEASPDNAYNAFLFTEMTQGRPLPGKDLAWSGDWFYSSIGGTMAMSRRVFWEEYILGKVREQHERSVTNSDGLIRSTFGTKFANADWFLNDAKPSSSAMCTGSYTGKAGLPSSLANGMSWSGSKTRATIQPVSWLGDSVKDVKQQVDNAIGLLFGDEAKKLVSNSGNLDIAQAGSATVNTSVWPVVGKNTIMVRQELDITTTMTASLNPCPSSVHSWIFTSGLEAVVETELTLAAVTTGGGLAVSSTVKTPILKPKYSSESGGLNKYLPDNIKTYLDDIVRNSDGGKAAKEYMESRTAEASASVAKVAEELGQSLSDQGRFIFPGGGTFDMKDPLFSHAGDLLIGLSYVERKLS